MSDTPLLDAAPMSRTVVVAGAGTGKTHALVERYLWALLGLEDTSSSAPNAASLGPERLLAITFTEKAAHEMRARLERRLGDLRYAPDREPDVIARAQSLGRALDDNQLEALRRSLSGAPIFTFHAFCARLLRDHALAAGLDPGFVVLEPDDEQRLLQETAEACVIDALQGAPATSPSSGERALTQDLVAELVARVQLHGFGERKGLVECLVDLHGTLAERGLDAATLPLATPLHDVDASLARVAACVAALKPLVSGQGAMRALAVDEARAAVAAVRAATPPGGAVDDPEAASSRAFRDLQKLAGGNWGGNKVTGERRALASAVDALGAALVDEFTRDLAPAVRALLVELDVRQRREKHARGFLAFGDLLLTARDLLRDAPSVRRRVHERFARVLVDEYQDTSPVQDEILALLQQDDGAAPRSEPGAHTDGTEASGQRFFAVGDPKQSIYGFRGADASVFTRALANARREELTVSRRSTAPIVAVANLVAAHALPRGSFGVDPAQLVPLTSLRSAASSSSASSSLDSTSAGAHWLVGGAAPASADGAGPEGALADGAAARLASLSPHERESLVVARKLRAHVDAGDFSAGDVAILVRRGKAAVPLARALARVGLPSVVVGGDGFFLRPEVADVIAALTLAADPSDELAVLTVLRSPLVAVPDDALLALYERLPDMRGLTWPRVVEQAPQLAPGALLPAEAVVALALRVRAFDAVLDTVRKRLHEEPLGRAVDALLDDGRYAAACAVEPDAPLRLRNLEKLRHLVTRAGGRNESALVAVARLAAALDDPPPEPLAQSLLEADERRAVRIMTIHQAKGLEFPVVVLADAGSGLRGESDDVAFDPQQGLAVTARGRPIAACAQRTSTPTRPLAPTAIQAVRRRMRERSEGELARLLYVAVTRARDRLFVVGAPRRSGPGSLLGQLEVVRAADAAALDALLPRVEVDVTAPLPRAAPAPSPSTPASLAALDVAALHLGARAALASRVRVRASDLGARVHAQMALSFFPRETPELDDEERLPPRVAGRLSHTLLALVASERREALVSARPGDAGALVDVVRRCARSLGALDVPAELFARCAVTLAGPVRALLDEGWQLAFEESLWLERDDVVVEGKADIVARRPDAAPLVVELKLTAERARGESAQLQVAAYAAALEQRGERAVRIATWALGDAAPPAPLAFAKAQRGRLDRALAALTAQANAPSARA